MNDVVSEIKRRLNVFDYGKRYMAEKNMHELNLKRITFCPFHKNTETPSFSVTADGKTWRCFGSCKMGGDVIRLHQVNKGFSTRGDAIDSLARTLGIDTTRLDLSPPLYPSDPEDNELRKYTNQALKLAKDVPSYLDLDYIMTKFQTKEETINDLIDYINKYSTK